MGHIIGQLCYEPCQRAFPYTLQHCIHEGLLWQICMYKPINLERKLLPTELFPVRLLVKKFFSAYSLFWSTSWIHYFSLSSHCALWVSLLWFLSCLSANVKLSCMSYQGDYEFLKNRKWFSCPLILSVTKIIEDAQ